MDNSCPRCGSVIYKEDRFCGICGFNLAHKSTAKPVAGTQVDLKLSDIRFNLAMIYYKKGDYAKALDAFENLLKEDPDNPQVKEMATMAKAALQTT